MKKIIFLILVFLVVLTACSVNDSVEDVQDNSKNPTYKIILSSGETIVTREYTRCVARPSGEYFMVNCYKGESFGNLPDLSVSASWLEDVSDNAEGEY